MTSSIQSQAFDLVASKRDELRRKLAAAEARVRELQQCLVEITVCSSLTKQGAAAERAAVIAHGRRWGRHLVDAFIAEIENLAHHQQGATGGRDE